MVCALRDRLLAGPAGVERPFTADEMIRFAESVDLECFDLEQFCAFKSGSYTRNRVHLNEHFELVVICWEPRQASSIHDHGQSNCLYRVLDGVMVEECFDLGPDGMPQKTKERSFQRGEVTLAPGDRVHRIHNRSDDKLMTLHIYSPPLDSAVTHFTPVPTYAE